MPNYDFQCQSETCGRIFEGYVPLAEYPRNEPCPDCGGETHKVFLPKSVSWNVDPVVVFKGPDGSYRFPGDANGLSAKQYERDGFQRVEIRGAAEMRRFEKHMNAHEYSRAQRQTEAKQAAREAREREMRAELRSRMTRMSAFGRSLAKAVMTRNDNRPRERTREAGFHSEVYAMDRSNRSESRDNQGRRRRD